jgi:hypothetical protein
MSRKKGMRLMTPTWIAAASESRCWPFAAEYRLVFRPRAGRAVQSALIRQDKGVTINLKDWWQVVYKPGLSVVVAVLARAAFFTTALPHRENGICRSI